TYRLQAAQLCVEATVLNPANVPLPFGLGYHPYFRVPLVPGASAADCWIETPARTEWELVDSLPTGVRRSLPAALDLQSPRRYTDLALDHLVTDLEPPSAADGDALRFRGRIRQLPQDRSIRLQ